MSQAQRHARPLNRSESQARTRAALLDAAEALIVEHSIPALSLRAVCTRAGYTQGAFYSNFADREELLLEVMERNLEQKAASLEQMLATCGDAGLDGTLACILNWLDTIHHRGEWARIAMELRLHAARDAAFSSKLAAAQARIDQRFGAHIAGVAKRFGLKPVLPAEQIAQALLLLWQALALQPAGEGLRKGPREVAFYTCLRALLGVSP